jgi:hypothetical protein
LRSKTRHAAEQKRLLGGALLFQKGLARPSSGSTPRRVMVFKPSAILRERLARADKAIE